MIHTSCAVVVGIFHHDEGRKEEVLLLELLMQCTTLISDLSITSRPLAGLCSSRNCNSLCRRDLVC